MRIGGIMMYGWMDHLLRVLLLLLLRVLLLLCSSREAIWQIKGVFGTALLPFFQLRSTNSTMEQLHCGVRGAGATP
jgi:hypothetical protein